MAPIYLLIHNVVSEKLRFGNCDEKPNIISEIIPGQICTQSDDLYDLFSLKIFLNAVFNNSMD